METKLIQKVRFYLSQNEWKEMINRAEKLKAEATLSRLKMAGVIIHNNLYFHSVSFDVKDEQQALTLKAFNLPVADRMVDWIMNPIAAQDHQRFINNASGRKQAVTVADAKHMLADDLEDWE